MQSGVLSPWEHRGEMTHSAILRAGRWGDTHVRLPHLAGYPPFCVPLSSRKMCAVTVPTCAYREQPAGQKHRIVLAQRKFCSSLGWITLALRTCLMCLVLPGPWEVWGRNPLPVVICVTERRRARSSRTFPSTVRLAGRHTLEHGQSGRDADLTLGCHEAHPNRHPTNSCWIGRSLWGPSAHMDTRIPLNLFHIQFDKWLFLSTRCLQHVISKQ